MSGDWAGHTMPLILF